MIFMREEIAELLGVASSTMHESANYSAQTSGPARLKKLEFLQDDPNCWALANATVSETQKTIIFSHWLLAERVPTSTELNLFQAFELFGYKVMLWQGPAIPFSQYQSLSSSTEFWQKRGETYPATEQAVKETLAQQGITLDGVVLDYANYQTLLRKCATLETISSMSQEDIDFFATCSPESLDLIGLDLEDQQTVSKIRGAVDITKIKYVQLPDPSLWPFVQKIFPNVISFTNFAFNADSDELHPDLTELHIVKGQMTVPFLQAINGLKKLHTLSIGVFVKSDVGVLACPDNLFSLKIDAPLELIVTTTSFSLLEKFKSTKSVFDHFICGSPQNIKQLEIHEGKINLKDELSKFTQLEILKLLQLNLNIDAFYFPTSLKTLVLKEYGHHNEGDMEIINLSACNQLTSCEISIDSLKKISLPVNLKKIIAKGNQLEFPDISRLSQLECFTFQLAWRSSPDSLESFPTTLKKIHLYNCRKIEEYDFSQFVHLVDLKLVDKDDTDDKKVKLPAGLRKYSDICSHKIDFSLCQHLEEMDCVMFLPLAQDENFLPKTLKNLRIMIANLERETLSLPFLPKLEQLDVNSGISFFELQESSSIIRLNVYLYNVVGDYLINIPFYKNLEYYYSNLGIRTEASLSSLKEVTIDKVCSYHSSVSYDFSCSPNLKKIRLCNQWADEFVLNLSTCSKLFHADISYAGKETIHFPQNKWLKKNIRNCCEPMQNHRNTVSVYRPVSKKVIDVHIIPPTSYIAEGEIKTELTTARPVTRHQYTLDVLNQIKVNDQREIEISTKEEDEKEIELLNFKQATYDLGSIREWKQAAEKFSPDNAQVFVAFEAIQQLDPKKYYPLPFLGIPDKNHFQIQMDPPDSIDLFWSYTSQQFKIKPRSAVKGVKIFFLGRQANHLLKMPLPDALLPQPLRDFLDQEIPKIPELDFLKESLSSKDKIKRLKAFCQSFSVKTLDQSPQNGFERLLAIITEKKGVCRHRSDVFVILGRYISNVFTEAIVNEEHMYGRVFYLHEDGQVEWEEHDFGGGERLDLTPPEIRTSLLPEIAMQPKKINNRYLTVYSAAAKKNQLRNIMELSSNHVVIEITSSQDPFLINKEIISQLIKSGIDFCKRHLYLHHPDDLRHFNSTFKIDSNGRYRKNIPGPLKTILQEGGKLVINWSNFMGDIARYVAGLTYMQRTASGHVQIIGFKTADIPDKVFGSDVEVWTLAPDFLQPQPIIAVCEEKMDSVEIDLAYDLFWREKLLGDVTFTERGIQVTESALLAACQQNQQLIIYNAPTDASFKTFLKRIQHEGKLLYQGEMTPVSVHGGITLSTQPHPSTLPNVTISLDNPSDKRQRIYLGLYNLHECIERLVLSAPSQPMMAESGVLNTRPGYLHDINTQSTVFYLTESIPKNDWIRLLQHIKKHYTEKEFHFVLAPGVSVLDVCAPNNFIHTKENIVLTNDIDYVSALLAQTHHAEIVHITPDTAYTDLIADLRLSLPDGSQHLHAVYTQKPVLQALCAEEKKTIILCGEPSPTLYQQLLPLLAGHYDQQSLKGQLFAVIPAGTKLHLLQKIEKHYTFADYQEILLKENKENEKLLEQLQAFYAWAEKLPKGGIGRPSDIKPSYHLLRRMLQKLRKPSLHPNNPIKGLFLYDYPRISSDYAYLNVMAKYLLTSNRSGIRYYKLQTFDLSTKEKLAACIWEVLNCFNGQELHVLLGNELSVSIDATSFPKLTLAALDRVWNKISQFSLQADAIVPTEDSTEKQQRQLDALRRETDFIFIKGEAGIGKTHSMKGRDDGIVFVDEGNTKTPGQLDFLKSEPRQKVVTGNPETYPGRYHHQVLRDHAETLYFKKPSAALERKILRDLLQPNQLADDTAIEKMRQVYHLIQMLNPLYVYSLRDLINLGHRFVYLTKKSEKEPLFHACVNEFIGTLASPDARNTFRARVATDLEVKEVDENPIFQITEQLIIDRQRKYIVDIFTQSLAMRKMGGKAAIVIEGTRDSRIDEIADALLAQEDILEIGMDCTEQDILNKLADAFQEGKTVHLHELNLMPHLEKILLHYLEGVDAQGQPPDKPGFFLVVTQRSSYEIKCKVMSQAFRNRAVYVNAGSASDLELIESARLAGIEAPDEAVAAFREVQKEHPSIGLSTFFNEFPRLQLKKSPVLQPVQEKELSFSPAFLQSFLNSSDTAHNDVSPRTDTLAAPVPASSEIKVEYLSMFFNDFQLKERNVIPSQDRFDQAIQLLESFPDDPLLNAIRHLKVKVWGSTIESKIGEETYKLVCQLTDPANSLERKRQAIHHFENNTHPISHGKRWLCRALSVLIGAAMGFVVGFYTAGVDNAIPGAIAGGITGFASGRLSFWCVRQPIEEIKAVSRSAWLFLQPRR